MDLAQDRVGLRDQRLPGGASGFLRIDGEQPVARRLPVGQEVQGAVDHFPLEQRVDLLRHGNERRPLGLEILDVQIGPGPALEHPHHHVAAVRRDAELDDLLRLARLAEDRRVFRPVAAEAVEEDVAVVVLLAGRDLSRGWVAGVVEAAVVRQPSEAAVARVGNDVLERLARLHVDDMQGALLVAAERHAVGEKGAVLRRVPPVDGGRAVRAERVRVDQHPVLPHERVADVQDRLVLLPLAARVEVAASPGSRRRERADRQEPRQAVARRAPAGARVEDLAGVGVLRFDPGARFGARAVLEPPIGVGDRDTEQVVHDLVGPGHGRLSDVARGARRRRRKKQRSGEQDEG